MNKIEKRRVLFFTNTPSPYRVDFFNELGKVCDLTVLFERRNKKEKWQNNNFLNFKAVFLKGIKKDSNMAFCPEIIKYFRKDLFDIIIIGRYESPTGMMAINYLNIKKIPFVLSTDGGMIKEKENFIKRTMKNYYISSAEFWLSTGNKTTQYLKYYGANSKGIFVYPFTSVLQNEIVEYPINNKVKKDLKDKYNISEKKVILSVGQYIPRKGFDTLLHACENLPRDWGVYIVGGNPTEEYIEIKEKLGLTNVHFISFKSREELREYYMLSDIFVLPTREDIWGLVINEAMAYGLPIITTNKCIAGLELVEDHQNGFIVPVNESTLLSKYIHEILKDDLISEKMSKRSLEKIRNYTIEKMAQEHIRIFQYVLDENFTV